MQPSSRLQPGPVGVLLLTLITLFAVLPAASAQAPSNLSDLNYQDAGWAADQLSSRGYWQTSNDPHRGVTFEYWWNSSANTCIQLQIDDQKVNNIATTSSTDCGQYHNEATKADKHAGLAVAAAALIGAAALAHESHHRDGRHGDSSQSISDFDRGYRDGLHREDYHNYSNSDAYSDGYNAGVDQRAEETQHRSRSGYGSGYRQHVTLSDLNGARASSAESELESRGFRSTGGYKDGGRSMMTWYNSNTHQCVQVTTADGRVAMIDDLSEGNCQ